MEMGNQLRVIQVDQSEEELVQAPGTKPMLLELDELEAPVADQNTEPSSDRS